MFSTSWIYNKQKYTGIILCMIICLAIPAICVYAVENPLLNPSFEYSLDFGWSAYYLSSATPTMPGSPGTPNVGIPGSDFNLLPPYDFPEGLYACGLESPAGTSKNGGIYQSFMWTNGKADISVKVRSACGNFNNPNQCFVRIGLAPGVTNNPNDVTQWEMSPQALGWTTLTLPVPENTTAHTLFIEAHQPAAANDIMSTLWDDVRFTPYIKISNLKLSVPGDPTRPDTTARLSWTTNLPSTARVDYKCGNGYWKFIDIPAMNWNHSILLTDLQPGTTCVYKITNTNPTCVPATASDSFDVPIHISDVKEQVAGFDVAITWKTDVPSESWVEIGPTTAYGRTEGSSALTTDHSVLVTGLDDMVTYHYRVSSVAPNYTRVYSGDQMVYMPSVLVAGLRNGSFEEPNGGTAASLYPWTLYTNYPGDSPIDGLIGPFPKTGMDSWCPDIAGIKAFEGSYFLGAESRMVYKNGGALQQVYNETAGLSCFAARFASYQSADAGITDTRVNIGLDPTGGTDPNAASVIWWTGISPTNDNKWYPAGVLAYVPKGIVTVFLGTTQEYALSARAIAFDDAVLGTPPVMGIGALRNAVKTPGAQLENKIVTYVDPTYVTYEGKTYQRAYVQEPAVPAGIGALLGPIVDTENPPDLPSVGDKITLTGALVPLGKEIMIMSPAWSVQHISNGAASLPAPVALNQKSIGGNAFNQQSLTKPGLCNLGLRIKLFGKVTWQTSTTGGDAYIDDGTGLYDPKVSQPATGIRVRLAESVDRFYNLDDYMTVTGVLTIQNIGRLSRPKYAYVLVTNTPDDWAVVKSAQ